MSDTPRTDEASNGLGMYGNIVPVDFARKLERELNEAEAALKKLGYEKHGFGWCITIVDQPQQPELATAKLASWKHGMTDAADICDTVDASMPQQIILAARNLRTTMP